MANKNTTLSSHIKQFFATLTDDEKILALAENIQQALEKGHTAIKLIHENNLKPDIITHDGKSGYIVLKDKQAAFRRFYHFEQNIKKAFIDYKQQKIEQKKLQTAIKNVITWSNLTIQDEIDWQWQACLSALFNNRLVLDGGPGTGKTTTIVRLLMLYIQLYPDNKIMLAAPTGKAANRMTQSINQNLINLNCPQEITNKLQIQAKTIHRLLAYNPKTNLLTFNRNKPLPYDLVIIDESSMLDVSLANALINAMKDNSNLVLIGDKNQLPAVDAGNVFADLCQILEPHNQQQNILQKILNAKEDNFPIPNYVKLIKNYRFQQDSIIANLCDSLIAKDCTKFKSYKINPDFHWHNPQNRQEKSKKLNLWLQNIPKQESYMILCATNNGENSVNELNDIAKQLTNNTQELKQDAPIIVTKNDYNLDVYNGDMSYLEQQNDKWYATFIIEGKQQRIQIQALNWQIAHAISIHKAQGSEYDHVLITLNENTEHELTNALLYTAISRAKKTISLWASERLIEKIILNQEKRLTFLK